MATQQLPLTYRPAAPIWCAGCGHFAVQGAIESALARLDLPPHEVVILAGIGCSGTVQNNVGTYGYHALHGRVLPAATGVALSNPSLTVIGAGGDGDGYAIGLGHLAHAFRRDVSLLYIVMNNETYGLTKGQHSPTHDPPVAYESHTEASLDAVALGLSVGATGFIARGYSGWYEQLERLTVEALTYTREQRGFAFLEVISPCITYRDAYPEWEHALVDLEAEADYDPRDRAGAFARSVRLREDGQLPAGLIYRDGREAGTPRPSPAHARTDLAVMHDRYVELAAAYTLDVDAEPVR
ncbi:2-oxoacid:ferredoxin oxidoreductase subunit beta [Egibacter rhizosphaerae]|uniref:2-oxoacid:ferredoxin oxidoreductase subunit beta n=1 Tax=Egibacter rhizosphaerae TaxID=1670831 RepID=A0A411YFA2_9ACTN|nr:thiamine pyrophosphate-dependent enzyme [Egibacter rhizosphaerae]QBI19923.1 2-oxoacid:ferredoxin oxidoreductase subunit beta [Egibacter rhizosphaerae]